MNAAERVLAGLEADGILTVIRGEAGCVGCLGTGIVQHARHGGAACPCLATCDTHGDDPCPDECPTALRFEAISEAVEAARHTPS